MKTWLPAGIRISAVSLLLLACGLAHSATLVVTTTADPGTGTCGPTCSLRDAINAAAPNDTITFAIPASDAGCTAPDTCTIALAEPSGPLDLIYNALTIDGRTQHITIDGGGNVTLLRNFTSGLQINQLTLSNGACIDNPASPTSDLGAHCLTGGGILNGGVLTVTNSTFFNNFGGVSYCDFPHHCFDSNSGGAIANFGSLTVNGSTFVGNSVGGFAEGAAIASFSGTVVITNSTFSGNSGNTVVFNGTNDGASAYSTQAGSLVLTNSTISSDSGAALGNQGIAAQGGGLTLSNTIVSGNSGGSCSSTPQQPYVPYTPIIDGGGNVNDDTSCALTQVTSLSSTNPNLGPLQDNGGLTQTMALTGGSPAAASGIAANCPSTDQRGIARPGSGQNCSSGAFQYVVLSCPTGSARVGLPYSSGLAAIGGVSPYTFANAGGLPPGLSLDVATGAVSGTPTATGVYSFTGQVTDSVVPTSETATAACAITVSPPPALLTVSPNNVFFGILRFLSLKISTVTVVNTGSVAVSIPHVAIVPGNAGSNREFIALNLCPASLPVRASCKIAVAFFALSFGNQSAALQITSSAQGSPQSIPLSAIVVR